MPKRKMLNVFVKNEKSYLCFVNFSDYLFHFQEKRPLLKRFFEGVFLC